MDRGRTQLCWPRGLVLMIVFGIVGCGCVPVVVDGGPASGSDDAGLTDGGGIDAGRDDAGSPSVDGGAPGMPDAGTEPPDAGEHADDAGVAPTAITLTQADYAWIVDANKGTLPQLDNMAAFANFNTAPAQDAFWPPEALTAALAAVAYHRYSAPAGSLVEMTYATYDGAAVTTAQQQVAVVQSPPFDVRAYPVAPVFKSNPTEVFVHYMPWFEAAPTDGYWGLHWTMATQDPDIVDVQGRRQIASHFYPRIGPYGSSDPDLIEYHLLLMKLAGIDGVLIDWYGTHDVNDYATNLVNSNALIDATDEVGIRFGIVYEDRTTEAAVMAGAAATAVQAATADFVYMRDTYFSRPHYIEMAGAPLVLAFTPVHIESPAAWSTIFGNAAIDPTFLPLWGQEADVGAAGDGVYAWFHGGADWAVAHTLFATEVAPAAAVALPSAFPGFQDFYAEGGWGEGSGFTIAHQGAQTLAQSLQIVDDAGLGAVQLVTWNDLGEGTMIEPTEELGYAPLNAVHAFAGVDLDASWLPEVERLYALRKAFADDDVAQLRLDQVFQYLRSIQLTRARDLLDRVEEGG